MPSRGTLVQIFLPRYDNDGRPFGEDEYARTRAELVERHGGLTAYQRAPARGLWKTEDGEVAKDDVVIFEVMVETLDYEAWTQYRRALERRFRQDTILVRAIPHEVI
jgi:hypothetical protein